MKIVFNTLNFLRFLATSTPTPTLPVSAGSSSLALLALREEEAELLHLLQPWP